MPIHLKLCLVGALMALSLPSWADYHGDASSYAAQFSSQVAKNYQVEIPADTLDKYKAALLAEPALAALAAPEFVVVVNRNPSVQTLAIFLTDGKSADFVGAARVSTGAANRKEYFFTPTGLFENKREFGNYRAEGTKNENGVRGLGSKGLRVFDFGWQASNAGWGKKGPAQIRLQMHGTDPDLLEQRLGTPASKGCVRVHHDVNKFIDENGVMDQHYASTNAWVLSKNKKASPYDGRYMLVVDLPKVVPAAP